MMPQTMDSVSQPKEDLNSATKTDQRKTRTVDKTVAVSKEKSFKQGSADGKSSTNPLEVYNFDSDDSEAPASPIKAKKLNKALTPVRTTLKQAKASSHAQTKRTTKNSMKAAAKDVPSQPETKSAPPSKKMAPPVKETALSSTDEEDSPYESLTVRAKKRPPPKKTPKPAKKKATAVNSKPLHPQKTSPVSEDECSSWSSVEEEETAGKKTGKDAKDTTKGTLLS